MHPRAKYLFVLLVSNFIVSHLYANCFIRGDSNCDGEVNLSDPIHTLTWLFREGVKPCCLDAADADDEGRINITDPINTLGFLFFGIPQMGSPFPNCGEDPTPDELGCENYSICPDTPGCRIGTFPVVLKKIENQTLELGDSLNLVVELEIGELADEPVFTLLSSPEGMTLSTPQGELNWTNISESFLGSHQVSIGVENGFGEVDFIHFEITVIRPQSPPTAVDDSFVIHQGEVLEVAGPGILSNDFDLNGDALTAELIDKPSNGELVLSENGSFTYTPLNPISSTREGLNLSYFLINEFRASGVLDNSYVPENITDAVSETSWVSNRDLNNPVYIEIVFPQDVTVRRLQTLANNINFFPAGSFNISEGSFTLFNREQEVLWESERLAMEDGGNIEIEVPEIEEVASARFTAFVFEQGAASLSEFLVFGDAVPEKIPVKTEWTWEGSEVVPESVQVIGTPIVADIDLDGMPEVIFGSSSSTDAGSIAYAGELRVLRGTGEELFTVTNPDHKIMTSAQPAVGNIDDDPELEIIAIDDTTFHIRAFEPNGELKWTSEQTNGFGNLLTGAPAIADLDQDGEIEIIVVEGSRVVIVFNAEGKIKWSVAASYGGGFPSVADIDLDGDLEIVVGNSAVDHEGNLLFKSEEVFDGFHAIGNFDDDPFPEIVVVAFQRVFLMDHEGNKIWDIESPTGRGGPPTVGDFDSDGQAEIGIAGATAYVVLEANGQVLWSNPTQDGSSGVTGSTLFDFENDGSPEVVYSDETKFWIFRGADGFVLYETELRSGTINEYPVVADIDADGHAEIVVGANQTLNTGDQHGIWVFGGVYDDWVRARPIWNQYAYHVTNVNTDGSIPQETKPFWLLPGLNSFRQNTLNFSEAESADSFTYRARDAISGSETATVYLQVLPPNTGPAIQSNPDRSSALGFKYLYAVQAVDIDRDPLTFSLVDSPEGMTIDPQTGLIEWLPTALGEFPVTAKVEDDEAYAAFQHYILSVVPPLTVPSVVGQPEAQAREILNTAGWEVGRISQAFHPSVLAGQVAFQTPKGGLSSDPNLPVQLILSLGIDPRDIDGDQDGFSINQGDCDDQNDKVFPGADEIDDDGVDQNCDGEDGRIGVSRIVVTPVEVRTIQGTDVQLTCLSLHSDGTSQVINRLVSWSSSDTDIVEVDAGLLRTVGEGVAEVTASLNGEEAKMVIGVVAPQVTDVTPPEADISNPEPGAILRESLEIQGTASDENFVNYTLEIAPAGTNDFSLIQEGTEAVEGGALGVMDPTTLLADLYDLRLTVNDANGNQSESIVPFEVEGDLPVGQFSLKFTDLSVPLAGFPLEVQRTYDSRNKSKGDFGIGWNFNYQSIKVRSNQVLGENWIGRAVGLSFGIVPVGERKVSVYLPNGRVEVFDFEPTPRFTALFPPSFMRPAFTPRPGTRGTLEALDLTGVRSTGSVGNLDLFDDTTGANANPQLFLYTDQLGTEIEIHKIDGVKRIKDANGNEMVISRTGVTHSSGTGITIERDDENRITRITDPMGQAQHYTYSANGDLIAHTDRLGNITRFKYNSRHGLLEIIAPNGLSVTRYEYDDSGRVVASIDAEGNRTEVEHDLENRVETTRFEEGIEKTYAYDERGNILEIKDELGNATQFTYDDQNRLLSERTPEGRSTLRSYDALGRINSITHPSGTRIQYERDSNGRMTARIQPNGAVTQYEWDARGNLVSVRDALGNVTENAYDSRGNLTRSRDAEGNTQIYEYDSNGRVIRSVSPDGVERLLDWDLNGNLLSTSIIVSTPDGPREEISEFIYNAGGQPTTLRGPSGQEISFEYDALGNRSAVISADGRRTEMTYNISTQLERLRYPDGEQMVLHYDPRDRLRSLIGPDGSITNVNYDAAGRPRSIIYPDDNEDPSDNPQLEVSLDADGLAEAIQVPGQRPISFERDDRGEIHTVSSAGQGQLLVTQDAFGRMTRTEDSEGNVTRYEYDLLDRLVLTRHPNGSTEELVYDKVGNLIEVFNSADHSTRFEYDSMNRLSAVVNPLGGRTQYFYNEKGQLAIQEDALGRRSWRRHDERGRLIALIRPGGTRAEFTYNKVDQLATRTDFLGQETQFIYNDRGRLTEKTYPDGSSISIDYNTNGKMVSETDSRGRTLYEYDAMGRLSRRTEPDGRSISYTRNQRGYITEVETPDGVMSYTYFDSGLLRSAQAPNGDTIQYGYDSVGRLTSILRPNGLLETREYNSRNKIRLLEIENEQQEKIESYSYEYNSRGFKSSVLELNGRRVEWEYDELDRLTVERIHNTENEIREIVYTYDAVGNRVQRNDSTLGVTDYTYNFHDQLVRETTDGETTNYSYDRNGNLLRIESSTRTELYVWDADNRLRQARVMTGDEDRLVEYQYDSVGQMVSRTVDGVETRYLIDTQRDFTQIVHETSLEDNSVQINLWGVDLAGVYSSGEERFPIYDGHSGVRLQTASNGSVQSESRWDAWGETLGSPSENLKYGYRGERLDSVTGKYYLRARHYDPMRGRLLSTDPFEGTLQEPISRHRYLYAHNNPIELADPSGLNAETLSSVISALSILAVVNAGIGLAINVFSDKEQVEWSGSFKAFVISTSIVDDVKKLAAKDFSPLGPSPGQAVGLTSYSANSSCENQEVFRQDATWITPVVGAGLGFGIFGGSEGEGFTMYTPGVFDTSLIGLFGFSFFAGYTAGIGEFSIPDIPIKKVPDFLGALSIWFSGFGYGGAMGTDTAYDVSGGILTGFTVGVYAGTMEACPF